jgi:hypothetical protein
MALDDKILSDEQVDQLNSDDVVKAARLNFIRLRTISNAEPSPENVERANQAAADYAKIFNEKLFEVMQHPAQPKSVAVKNLKGFKR